MQLLLMWAMWTVGLLIYFPVILQVLRNKVKPFVKDTIPYLSKAIKDGKTILVEGAQSNVLDIDFGKNDSRQVILNIPMRKQTVPLMFGSMWLNVKSRSALILLWAVLLNQNFYCSLVSVKFSITNLKVFLLFFVVCCIYLYPWCFNDTFIYNVCEKICITRV